MKVNTKVFGEIDIDAQLIINFENGIIGFPNLKRFILIFDEEDGVKSSIKWLQSLEEPGFALPVMDPLLMVEDYNPSIEDELLKPLENLNAESMLVLVTVTVPKDIKGISINLRAPIIINTENRKAAQMIVDGDEYPVKYYIYDKIKTEKAGE